MWEPSLQGASEARIWSVFTAACHAARHTLPHTSENNLNRHAIICWNTANTCVRLKNVSDPSPLPRWDADNSAPPKPQANLSSGIPPKVLDAAALFGEGTAKNKVSLLFFCATRQIQAYTLLHLQVHVKILLVFIDGGMPSRPAGGCCKHSTADMLCRHGGFKGSAPKSDWFTHFDFTL